MFRPGIGRYTLDFCGGRIPENISPKKAAEQIVIRELNIGNKTSFADFKPVNNKVLHIDSSFTNVGLYTFVATLSSELVIGPKNIGKSYALDKKGIDQFFIDVNCLQCRAAMREWLATTSV